MSCNRCDLRPPTTHREGFPREWWERKMRSYGSSFQSNRQNQGPSQNLYDGVLLTAKLRMHCIRLRSSGILIRKFRFESPATHKCRSKPPNPRSAVGRGRGRSGCQVIENAFRMALRGFLRDEVFRADLFIRAPARNEAQNVDILRRQEFIGMHHQRAHSRA